MSPPDLEKLRADFPANAIKQRAGGHGRMLSYVEGFTVIRRLNEACPEWDFAIVREWQDGPLLKAHVKLTIPGLGTREHVGVQVVNDRPGTEDVQAKGHITDALKKAATLFGVGLELYGPDYEAGEVAAQVQRHPLNAQGAVQRQAPPPTQETRAPASGGQSISQSQVKYLWALAEDKGVSPDEVHADILMAHGAESVLGLTKQQASKYIDHLTAKPPVAKPGMKQEPQKGNPLGIAVPEEPAWMRGDAGDDPYTG